jgi:hypothetical protein
MARSGIRSRRLPKPEGFDGGHAEEPTVSLEIWDGVALEAQADRLESLANGMMALGERGDGSASRALDLAHGLRASSWALEFVDPEDEDAVVVVVERLAELEADAASLLTLWQDDEVTRPYDASWKSAFSEDEPTRVAARPVGGRHGLLRR